MNYTNYNDWIKDAEKEFDKNHVGVQSGDLKTWFSQIAAGNQDIKDELKYHEKLTYPEINFLVSTVAWAFQPESYNPNTHKAVVEKNGKKTVFGQPEKLYKCLQNNWDRSCAAPYDTFNEITLGIPRVEDGDLDKYKNQLVKKSKKEKGDKNTSTTWIWVCSALQKRYKVFKNIDDLNNFIFAVSDMNDCGELQNYGLYVRDISELCLAYAILHGYSLDEEIELLQRADKILQDEQKSIRATEMSAENTYTQAVKSSFGEFLSAPSSFDKEDVLKKSFLAAVKASAKVFIRKKTDEETVQPNHWSSLKTLLGIRNSIHNDRTPVERNFESRIQSIVRLYDALIGENVILRYRPRTSLSKFLSQCLAVDDIQSLPEWCATREAWRSADRGAKAIREADQAINAVLDHIIKSHLRYICIFATMKDIQEDEATAVAALDLINKELRSAGFREIEDFEVAGDNAVTAKEHPADWFDWFVVQAIIFEEEQVNAVKDEQEDEDASVSGYETFMDYVFPDRK